jgi:hypothetical protein
MSYILMVGVAIFSSASGALLVVVVGLARSERFGTLTNLKTSSGVGQEPHEYLESLGSEHTMVREDAASMPDRPASPRSGACFAGPPQNVPDSGAGISK